MIFNIFYEVYNNIYNWGESHEYIVLILIEIGYFIGLYGIEKMKNNYEIEERRWNFK